MVSSDPALWHIDTVFPAGDEALFTFSGGSVFRQLSFSVVATVACFRPGDVGRRGFSISWLSQIYCPRFGQWMAVLPRLATARYFSVFCNMVAPAAYSNRFPSISGR